MRRKRINNAFLQSTSLYNVVFSILVASMHVEVHHTFQLYRYPSHHTLSILMQQQRSHFTQKIASNRGKRQGSIRTQLFSHKRINNEQQEGEHEESTIIVTENMPHQQQEQLLLPEELLRQPQDILLQQLDSEFQYNGRLLRGNSTQNRCGFVCIVGAPNMGKSTLLNALLQEDLCICTSRPQTTRHAIIGLLSTNHTQICFIDTPGIIDSPAYKLQEGMMEAVTSSLRDADVLLIVTDVYSTPIPNDNIFKKVQTFTKPIIIAINKIDLSTSNTSTTHKGAIVSVEDAVMKWRQLVPNAAMIIPTSSMKGPNDTGVVLIRRLLCGGPDVRTAIRNIGRPIPGMLPNNASINDPLYTDNNMRSYMLPLSPPLYDTDIITDRSERFVVSEIIRSVLFTTYQKELPYCCEVRITEFKEPKGANIATTNKKNDISIQISADIVVERDSQKIIVIGRNGQQIKQVGMLAREKIQDFLQQPVTLYLNVKVNKDWRKKEDQLRLYGYLS